MDCDTCNVIDTRANVINPRSGIHPDCNVNPSKSNSAKLSFPLPDVLTSSSGLKLAHLNVRSIKSNANNTIDQLRVMLNAQNIDIFAVSETWLGHNVSDAEIAIDGYDRLGRWLLVELLCM